MIQLTSNRNTLRHTVRIGAALAAVVVMNACGTASETDSGAPDSAVTTAADAGATTTIAPATADGSGAGAGDAAGTPAPVEYETNPALTSAQFVPASSPDLPCTDYNEATELPLFPCDSGPLVTQLQQNLQYASNADLVVDGFFGQQTYDAVRDLQQFFGMYDTGVVDQVFQDQYDTLILHEEFEDGDERLGLGGVDFVVDGIPMTTEEVIAMCTAIQESLTAEVTDEQVFACDSVDVRISSGD